MSSVTPAWLAPTRRAIDWTPLALIAAALLATAAFLGWRTIDVPGVIQHMAVAALSVAAVLGLADPARPLLQALPTSPLTRLARRVVLLIGATTFVTAVLVVAEHLLAVTPTAEPELAAALFALATVGTAVHAVCDPISEHANEIAAGSILLWVSAMSLPVAFIPDTVHTAWLHHPWPIAATATVVIVCATRWRAVVR